MKSLRYNTRLPSPRQLAPSALLGLWALLVIAFSAFAILSHYDQQYGGRSLVAALIAFSLLLLVMLLFAAYGITERFLAAFGFGAAWLLGIILFLIFLAYAIGTGTATLLRLAAAATFILVPLLLLVLARNSSPGCWQDYLVIATIWSAVKFGPSHWLWPYRGGRLAYIFAVLTAVDIAIAAFLLLRRTGNIGYSIGWCGGFGLSIVISLALFAAIAIPLGIRLHFIQFAPRWSEWKSFIPLSIGILFFTAWPEEFLFRGLLQNHLTSTSKSPLFAWIAASVLFGFSHITNMHFPNWRYVLLATIAGLFYGWTWRRTGSIFASAILHGSVDILWHFLFLTP